VAIAPATLASVVLFENSFQTSASQTITLTNSGSSAVNFNVRRMRLPSRCASLLRAPPAADQPASPPAPPCCMHDADINARVAVLPQATATPNGLFGGWIATSPASAHAALPMHADRL